MKFRYFFLNGPVSPANMPKGATKVCRYDRKVYASSIQQDTWGFAEYDRPIQPVEQEQFRMVEIPGTSYCTNLTPAVAYGREAL